MLRHEQSGDSLISVYCSANEKHKIPHELQDQFIEWVNNIAEEIKKEIDRSDYIPKNDGIIKKNIKKMKEKDYTITRRRNVVQICTDVYRATSIAHALKLANEDQMDGMAEDDVNEWINLNDKIEYPVLKSSAILEVNPV